MFNKIIIFLIISTSIFCLDFDIEKQTLKNDWENFKNKKLILKKEQVIIFSGLTIGSFLLDEKINKSMKKSTFMNKYTDTVNPLGGTNAGIILLGLYGTSIVIDNDRLRKTSFESIESVVAAGILTGVFKHGFGRSRPQLDEGAFKFRPFKSLDKKNIDSFFSGHSAISWALVTPYAEEYNRALYLIPLSVSVSRVYKQRHWTSDVIFGAGVGFLSGYIFHNYNNENFKINGTSFEVKF